jgi:hypothetical protein
MTNGAWVNGQWDPKATPATLAERARGRTRLDRVTREARKARQHELAMEERARRQAILEPDEARQDIIDAGGF